MTRFLFPLLIISLFVAAAGPFATGLVSNEVMALANETATALAAK